jgi:DMSO/TMAO reductase YedYZ molybdopterin-dependent catalytic subunit
MSREQDLDAGVRRSMDRRRFLRRAAAGSLIVASGLGCGRLAEDEETRAAAALVREDGKKRLPPGQRLVERLRPMGGMQGDPSPLNWRLRIHGAVENPLEITYPELVELPQTELTCDVHCVTGWSCFDRVWNGVRVSRLAELARVTQGAAHVIFEAAYGYTANVPIREALLPNVLVVHHLDGDPLERAHGSPVRGLVPDLYFWKSAKWLTGIRFAERDEPGYWEVRGYHNHGDPWLEERYG